MNKLLLAALVLSVSACSGSPKAPQETATLLKPKLDPTQEAVMAYPHKTLDDPSSYQPGHWGKAMRGQQIDADALAAQDVAEKGTIAFAHTKRVFAENAAMAKHAQRLKDSLLHAYRYHELRTSGYPYLPS
jgi:hypothetical protein